MIEVREGRLGLGVHATHGIEPGQVVLQGQGRRVPRRTRFTIQVDHDMHVDFPPPIRLLNHSCAPNCGILIRRGADALEVRALRRIAAGEELTIDYAAFEAEIQFMPGPCLCGAPSCRGRVTGYLDLSESRRAALGPFVAEYLGELAARASRAG